MTMLIGLSVLGLLLPGPNSATTRPDAPFPSDLRVSLGSVRDTYYPGEALELRVTVVNASDRPVRGRFGGLNPVAFDYATLYWRRDGRGPFVEATLRTAMPPTMPEEMQRMILVAAPETKTLHRGQTATVDVMITFVFDGVTRRFVLDGIGQYEFKLRCTHKAVVNGVLESEVLRVEVVEPPASEREARAAYTPDLASIGAEGRKRLLSSEEMRAAADFVERFPGSLYAAPVKSGLRSALEDGKRKKQWNEVSRRLYEQLFANAESDFPPVLWVSLSTSTLWPADNEMVPIAARVRVLDHRRRDDLTATASLVSITCDDSCDLANDVVGADLGTDDRSFELRADRGRSGVGRTYTVKYAAEDATGKRVTTEATVTVPHEQAPSPWSAAGVSYRKGEVVRHEGYTWRATSTHSSAAEQLFVPGGFRTSGALWVKVPRGRDWDYPVRYEAGAEVTFGGATFRCREAHISSEGDSLPPSDPARWERIR